MNIVLTDAATVFDSLVTYDIFSSFGNVTVHRLLAYEEIAEAVKDADVILCNKSLLDRHTLRLATHLRYIGIFATGYNNIDLPFCREKGITVCNAGSYSTDAVAQHTFALLLELFSRIGNYNRFVQEGGWVASDTFSPFVCDHHEIAGKTLGIVGYGHIGSKVAKIAQAFGMDVICHTRHPKENANVRFVSFAELLAQSDVITVHCPLNDDSKRMFGKEQFAAMKKTAFFINTSRGGVIEEEALKEALTNGTIAAAALDVLTEEPMRERCVLLDAPHCFITPHVAWAPVETRMRLKEIVADNLRRFLDGHPVNVVS